MVQFRSQFGYDTEAASNESAIGPGGPSLTVQSMSEDTDLNVLMKRFGVTGTLPTAARLPEYGDFSHITDFRSAVDAVRQAEADFLEFPPDFRARFANSPQMLLEFSHASAENMRQVATWLGEYRVTKSISGESNPPAAAVSQAAGNAAASGSGGAGGSNVGGKSG